jgi:hypothetical protein
MLSLTLKVLFYLIITFKSLLLLTIRDLFYQGRNTKWENILEERLG